MSASLHMHLVNYSTGVVCQILLYTPHHADSRCQICVGFALRCSSPLFTTFCAWDFTGWGVFWDWIPGMAVMEDGFSIKFCSLLGA
jgi:hypothetical protein